jgi:hypothetical protein
MKVTSFYCMLMIFFYFAETCTIQRGKNMWDYQEISSKKLTEWPHNMNRTWQKVLLQASSKLYQIWGSSTLENGEYQNYNRDEIDRWLSSENPLCQSFKLFYFPPIFSYIYIYIYIHTHAHTHTHTHIYIYIGNTRNSECIPSLFGWKVCFLM